MSEQAFQVAFARSLRALVPPATELIFFSRRGWLKPTAVILARRYAAQGLSPEDAADKAFERQVGIPASARREKIAADAAAAAGGEG